ncbi:hypothetical protein BDU57DRAFT_93856 [Ampelomyces quisqualis]|uniref:Uncharacterized protein n=1 Tax=Ampelomyces quisqualis TaxID=50730 RepID=A0A6A5QAM6_AMPQU|nr:hypothetical protein BDU57DRAFT_93856 [Ampelomyces quisqualis]
MGRAVWGVAVAGLDQSGMVENCLHCEEQPSARPGRGKAAIGGGRGWACAGGWAIGGDALAMQVHACPRAHLPTLRSGSAHARQMRVVECWAVWGGAGVLVAALLSRAAGDCAGRRCRSAQVTQVTRATARQDAGSRSRRQCKMVFWVNAASVLGVLGQPYQQEDCGWDGGCRRRVGKHELAPDARHECGGPDMSP